MMEPNTLETRLSRGELDATTQNPVRRRRDEIGPGAVHPGARALPADL